VSVDVEPLRDLLPRCPASEVALRSDPGLDPDKQVNEDACDHRETQFGHLVIVCDGMGGHADGREAASLALSTILGVFDRAATETPPGEVLRLAIEEANARVHGMPALEMEGGRPGSTVVAVLVHARGAEVAHVGDSRAYLVHQGQAVPLTRDHSVVQQMVDLGVLTPEQASHHPDANRITRALGMHPSVEVEVRPQAVAYVAGDAFVLCSDGLSDLVDEAEIRDVVGLETASQAVGKLVSLANARGGHDNITIAILRMRESVSGVAVGVAPTVVQTAMSQPAPTLASSAPPEGVKAPWSHPVAVLPVVPRARRWGLVAVAGLALAAVAATLLGIVLVEHITARRGAHNPTASSGEIVPSAVASGSSAPLAPVSVGLPPPVAPSEAIPPLEPVPSGPRRHERP
jgi:protein phosphatase